MGDTSSIHIKTMKRENIYVSFDLDSMFLRYSQAFRSIDELADRIKTKSGASYLVQQEANFLFRSSYSDGEAHFCSLLSQATHTARSNLALCLAIFLSSSTLLPSSILIKQKQGKIIVISLFLRVQSKQSSETTNNILIKLAISHGAEQLMLVCYSRQGISLAHCQAAINTYPNTQ